MKLVLSNGTTVQVTDAQYHTAKEWAWRTFSNPSGHTHPTQIFPARDNVDNGYRRCCRKLIEKGVLRGDSRIGFILDNAVFEHMRQRL